MAWSLVRRAPRPCPTREDSEADVRLEDDARLGWSTDRLAWLTSHRLHATNKGRVDGHHVGRHDSTGTPETRARRDNQVLLGRGRPATAPDSALQLMQALRASAPGRLPVLP